MWSNTVRRPCPGRGHPPHSFPIPPSKKTKQLHPIDQPVLLSVVRGGWLASYLFGQYRPTCTNLSGKAAERNKQIRIAKGRCRPMHTNKSAFMLRSNVSSFRMFLLFVAQWSQIRKEPVHCKDAGSSFLDTKDWQEALLYNHHTIRATKRGVRGQGSCCWRKKVFCKTLTKVRFHI